MARPQSFGAKIANREKTGKTCPECGQQISYIKHYVSEPSDSGKVKFKQKVVGVCNCNKKEILG